MSVASLDAGNADADIEDMVWGRVYASHALSLVLYSVPV